MTHRSKVGLAAVVTCGYVSDVDHRHAAAGLRVQFGAVKVSNAAEDPLDGGGVAADDVGGGGQVIPVPEDRSTNNCPEDPSGPNRNKRNLSGSRLVDDVQLLRQTQPPPVQVRRHLCNNCGGAHAVLLWNHVSTQEPCRKPAFSGRFSSKPDPKPGEGCYQ